MILENPARTEPLILELASLWEESVRATHLFLREADIVALRPLIPIGIKEVDHLIVAYENGKPIGFMGIAKEKIEMLFLAPPAMGNGIGKSLMKRAIEDYAVTHVDVNEQNPNALAFYQHFGFSIYERTELDDMGNAFPILKLKQSDLSSDYVANN